MDEVAFSVAECLTRVRQGDEAAARSLVDHLFPTVIRIVQRNLPRKGSEEELAQDVFVKMFSNLGQYRGEVPLEHWVSRIATNHCINAIRAQKSRPEWRMSDLPEEQVQALDAVVRSTEEPHPAHAIAAREMVDALLECLVPEDRLIIRMLEIEGYSTQEIRDVTGWSIARIRIRAFRARSKLNKRFEKLKREGKL
jgi:RNA polymerase sigma factor (sigma-70 family)